MAEVLDIITVTLEDTPTAYHIAEMKMPSVLTKTVCAPGRFANSIAATKVGIIAQIAIRSWMDGEPDLTLLPRTGERSGVPLTARRFGLT